MGQLQGWEGRACGADEAVSRITSGSNVFLHGGSATCTPLAEALCRRTNLSGVGLYHLHTMGPAPWASPEVAGRIRSVSFFVGEPMREAVNAGRADFVPIFLSDIPGLINSGTLKFETAILHVSPPDQHGLCSLGTSCDIARAAADNAQTIIAEINDQMPRTHGRTVVPLSRVSAFIRTNRPLHEHALTAPSPVESRIGELIAGLVEDGSTLQMGIGAIPDAALARLGNKHDLGIHTEMFSDGLLPLMQGGVITNRRKTKAKGLTITSFVVGTKKLFDFVNDNPLVHFQPCDRTNDTATIRENDRVVAINSALQVDLTGQVCADSLGHRIYSGIGGQMDFIRGAALSKGGKPIIALPATAAGGKVSRIATELNPGAGVVTTRGHIHWIVTEYGAVNLHGLTLRQRGEALISIAHPDFRPDLRRALSQIRHFAL